MSKWWKEVKGWKGDKIFFCDWPLLLCFSLAFQPKGYQRNNNCLHKNRCWPRPSGVDTVLHPLPRQNSYQITLLVGGRITVWLGSSFSRLDSTASQLTNNNVFSCLSKSTQVKLETSWAMITPLMGYVLGADNLQKLWMCARQRNYNDGLTDCC